MSETLIPTPYLDAVNQCLFAIGESPVNTAEDSGNIDAVTALATLRNVSREVQQKGWHWNTDVNYFIAVSSPDGFLTLPANALKVDTVGSSQGIDVVQRGTKLYDRVRHTFTFTQGAYVDIVRYLAWDELPEAARNYITLRAARRFQQNSVGSGELAGFQQQDEVRALVDLQNAEAENADFQLTTGNADIARVMLR